MNIILKQKRYDINYLGQVIFDVFVKASGDDVFLKKLDECKEVASNILKLV